MTKKMSDCKEQYEKFIDETPNCWAVDVSKAYEKKEVERDWDWDSSPIAWGHFEKIYTSKNNKGEVHWSLLREHFNLDDLVVPKARCFSYIDNEKLKKCRQFECRPLICSKDCYKPETKEGCVFHLGGDCDFNFNQKKKKLFEKFLQDDEIGKALLELCLERHHSLANFSIIPTTGGLQCVKGSKECGCEGLDRFDRFLTILNKYYLDKGKDAILGIEVIGRKLEEIPICIPNGGVKVENLNCRTCNIPCLEAFLDSFDGIYDYCEKIYFISNKGLVNYLVKSGAEPIKNKEDVIAYMHLALHYWQVRETKFQQLHNPPPTPAK